MRRKIGAIGVLHGHLPMNRGEEGEGSIGSLFAHLPMDRSEVRREMGAIGVLHGHLPINRHQKMRERELLVVCLAI